MDAAISDKACWKVRSIALDMKAWRVFGRLELAQSKIQVVRCGCWMRSRCFALADIVVSNKTMQWQKDTVFCSDKTRLELCGLVIIDGFTILVQFVMRT